MSGMRQKLRFTAVLVVLVIILGTASYREQGKRQKLSFPESLDLVVVTVDGKTVTLREMAFYIAYEEGNMRPSSIIRIIRTNTGSCISIIRSYGSRRNRQWWI